MRRQREIRDALVALALFGGLIGAAILVDRQFGNHDLIDADGQRVRVIDGDSFAIGSDDIRLYGIDAPEYRQNCWDAAGDSWSCGREAKAALEILMREAGLRCESVAEDRYGRKIALCQTTASPDIGAEMVRQGWAVSLSFHDTPAYPFAEARAERSSRGIWQGTFIRPSQWRAEQRASQ